MRARSEAQRYRLPRPRAAAVWLCLLALSAALAACRAPDEHAAGPGGRPAAAAERPADSGGERPVVLFLGDSLTAGFGLTADEAYPALIQQRIDAAGLDYRVVNAGVSGDTSAGGLRRLDWLLRQPVAVLVLELGANDMLRGQSTAALADNLRAIIAETRAAHPEARTLIAGMRAPRNYGRRYADAFDAVYPDVARDTGAALIPFLLEDVATRADLNQSDGIHPTAAGQRIVADTVWRALEPLLRSSASAGG